MLTVLPNRFQIHHSAPCHADVPHPTDDSVSVIASNETGKIRVTWSRPTLGPGQVITGYSVQYRRRGTTSYTTHSVSGSNTTSYTITNLNLATVYEVRVAAVGPLGLSGYCCGNGKQVTTYSSECKAQIIKYYCCCVNIELYIFAFHTVVQSMNYKQIIRSIIPSGLVPLPQQQSI